MFVLISRQRPDAEQLADRARGLLAQWGAPASETIADSTYLAVATPATGEDLGHRLAKRDGDFALALGAMFYAGDKGAAAIAAALDDARSGRLDLRRAEGQFALLTRVDGRSSLRTDRLSAYPVYMAADRSVIADSVMAIALLLEEKRLSTQSIYEYVFNGCCLGEATLFESISVLPFGHRLDPADRSLHRLDDAVRARPFGPSAEPVFERVKARLEASAELVAQTYGTRTSLALSGGYDTRLLLAMLRRAGVPPENLFVYGPASASDVTIARQIAAGEGLTLNHVDKTAAPAPAPDAFAEIVARNCMIGDGYGWGGLFDNGAEAQERLYRSAAGRLHINGGGGEVLRNFFYLMGGRFTVAQFLHSFFFQFDPRSGSAVFAEDTYRHNVARKVKALLEIDRDWLERHEVEFLYPGLRCRSWFARENAVNGRAGASWLPFYSASVVDIALDAPIAAKHHGAFEARLIAALDPKLASYPTDYGHDFSGPPPLARRLRDYGTYLRPTALRRLSFRIQARLRVEPRPDLLTPRYLGKVIDPALPAIRALFEPERLVSSIQFARAATVEYLVERFGLRIDPRHERQG